MSTTKGLAFSIVGAAMAGIAWAALVRATDYNLWILAPVVGGAAGYGMMRATQMRGGVPAGALAALVTLCAIFGVRYFVTSSAVSDRLAVSDDDAIEAIASDVAAELEAEDITPYDEDGEYLATVYETAERRWSTMSEKKQQQYLASMNEEVQPAAAVLTPLALLFDFGILGTVCTCLAAGTAFKTASTRLEDALREQGLASDAEEAAATAQQMRIPPAAPASSGFSLIPPPSTAAKPTPLNTGSSPLKFGPQQADRAGPASQKAA